MLLKNNISCVLDIPKIEPDNWNLWWELWNLNKKPVKKIEQNHNKSFVEWEGFEIFRKDTVEPTTLYDFYYFNLEKYFPKMFLSISKLPLTVKNIIAVSSKNFVLPHTDFNKKNFYSIRCMLFNNNLNSTFYYYKNYKKVYQELPNTSNTWIYNDSIYPHGTDFNSKFFKILLIISGEIIEDKMSMLIEQSIRKYEHYCINI